MGRKPILFCAVVLAMLLCCGCESCNDPPQALPPANSAEVPATEATVPETPPTETEVPETAVSPVYEDSVAQEMQAIAEAPEAAIADILEPEASGELVLESGNVRIDYSNTADGYVMVLYNCEPVSRLKVQVKGPTTTYTYNLPGEKWSVFPLSDGNGTYQVKVFQHISGTKYALLTAVEQAVTLEDEFAPFLRPNQYVDYSASNTAVEKARELTQGLQAPLEKVQAIYEFVVSELTYDTEKAATVKSGYIPVLEEVLEQRKGICFDYASLMTGMLRSQGVPCKMVFGYASGVYHAWISVWTEETGWVDGAIFFDGISWHRLDPTYAAYDNRSDSIMAYIANGSNYLDKYYY